MDDRAGSSSEGVLKRALRADGASARRQLLAAASEDRGIRTHLRGVLLARLRGGDTAHQMRAVAELLAEVEALCRRDVERRLACRRAQVTGLRALVSDLAGSSKEQRPYTITRSLCEDLGFQKSVYSPASLNGWAPTTIAYHPQLGTGFSQLSEAIQKLSLPRGAAPREEEVMRTGRAIAVDPADVYRETYRPLVELSRPHGYLAVPVVAAGRVTGILHADHHDMELDEFDLRSLQSAAAVCAMAEERDALRSAIAARGEGARDAIAALQAALSELERSQLDIAEVLDARSSTEAHRGGSSRTPCAALTHREHEIFDLVATGAAAATIARTLAVSEGTVKSHIKRIYRKLGIGTRAEAAALFGLAHRDLSR